MSRKIESVKRAVQKVNERSHGVINPANAITVGGAALSYWSMPNIDTWAGTGAAAAANFADMADGKTARYFEVTGKVGDFLDHVLDKAKIFYAGYHLYKKNVVDKPLLGAVMLYNAATASATVYDRLANEQPQIEADRLSKRAFFGTSMGLGIQVIGHNLERNHPTAGTVVNHIGSVVGYGSLAFLGIPNALSFWDKARYPAPTLPLDQPEAHV